jgi:hypothetical protein
MSYEISETVKNKGSKKLEMIHFQNFTISAIDDVSENSTSFLYDVDLGIDTSNSTDEDGKQLF